MMTPRYRYFVVLGMMRTGSNLLQRNLDQMPSLNCHGELFNPAFINGPVNQNDFGMTCTDRDADPMALIEAMITAGKHGTLSGFRLFNGHNAQVINAVIEDPAAAKIILRRNPLDSFVSLKIARETDQWMLMRARARRTVRIQFDIAEYRDYLAQSDAFYSEINQKLKLSGQSAFFIDYEEVGDLGVLNGLGRWLGQKDHLDTLETTIQRQNPGPLEEKVENYAEMLSLLQGEGGIHRTGDGARGDRAAGLRFMHMTRSIPLLYAAIPGGPNAPVLRWMHGLDGHDTQEPDFMARVESATPFDTPKNRKALTDWQQTHPGHVCFTAVRHPFERAYDIFMSRIFGSGDAEILPRIRAHAEERFSMFLPAAGTTDLEALQQAGYGAAEHQAAFSAFLDFLRANLAGRTPMQVNALWAPQHEFVDGFSTAVTLGLVLREEDLIAGAAYLRKRFNLQDVRNAPLREPGIDTLFALDKIWSAKIEDKCRAIYAHDYQQFGFKDWAPR